MFRFTNTNLWLMSLVAATCLASPPAVLADDDSGANSGSTRIQIQRPANPLQASASVDRDLGSLNNDEASKLRSIFAQQAQGLKPSSFRASASQDDSGFRQQTPMLDRLRGQNNQTDLRGRAQDQGPPNAPFIWCQSINGGYYDCTNAYKGVVPGYRLRELGGKFADGTPVPTGAVKMNEAGHIWWQGNLSPAFKHY